MHSTSLPTQSLRINVLTLMGETSATCLPAWVSYTRTSPWLLPAQMYSPLLVAAKPHASDRPALALHPGTCMVLIICDGLLCVTEPLAYPHGCYTHVYCPTCCLRICTTYLLLCAAKPHASDKPACRLDLGIGTSVITCLVFIRVYGRSLQPGTDKHLAA